MMLKHVSNWRDHNDMVLSETKSVAMLFQTRQRKSKAIAEKALAAEITDTVLPTVSYSKLSGLHFDSHMTWEVHINQTHSKISKLLFLLRQIKVYLPLFACKLFYNAYILPHFDFCCVIWGTCSGKLLNDLCALQKKAARLILDTDCSERSAHLFRKLGWMPLADKEQFRCRCFNKECPLSLQDICSHWKLKCIITTEPVLQRTIIKICIFPNVTKKAFSVQEQKHRIMFHIW